MISASVDTSGLEFLISGLQNALVAEGGDVSAITQDEARLLALEISKRVGPRDRHKKEKNIPKEVGRVFMPAPKINWGIKKRGHGDMLWINAGENFLTGVRRDHYVPDSITLHDMMRAYLKAPGLTLGKKYQFIGSHGKQHVQEINRIMVKRNIFNEFIRFVTKQLGKMKGSWIADAKKIDPSKSVVSPKWIEDHVKNNNKSVADVSGLQNHASPSVEFGSTATGISKFEESVRFAVSVREKKVRARIGLVLSGYSKDVAKGIRPRRHAKD